MSLLQRLSPFLVGEIASWSGGVAITHLWMTGNKTLRLWLCGKDGVRDWILIETDLRYLSKLPAYLGELKSLKTLNLQLNAALAIYPKVTLEWLQTLPSSLTSLMLNFQSASTAWYTRRERIDGAARKGYPPSAGIDLASMFPHLQRFEMNKCYNFEPHYFDDAFYPQTLTTLDFRLTPKFDLLAWKVLPKTLTSLKLGVHHLPDTINFGIFSKLRCLGLAKLLSVTDDQLRRLPHSLEYLDLGKTQFEDTGPSPSAALLPPRLHHLKVYEIDANHLKNWIESGKSSDKEKEASKRSSLKSLVCSVTNANQFPASLEKLSLGCPEGTSSEAFIKLGSTLPPNLQHLKWANKEDLHPTILQSLPKSLTKLAFRIEDCDKMAEIVSFLDLPVLTRLTVSYVPSVTHYEPAYSSVYEWLEMLPPWTTTVDFVSMIYHKLSSNQLGYDGWYNIADAVEEGDYTLAEHLISLGSHKVLTKIGLRLAMKAMQRQSSDLLQLILKHSTLQKLLYILQQTAVVVGSLEMLKIVNRFIGKDDATMQSADDITILHFVVDYERIEIGEWLIQDPINLMTLHRLKDGLYRTSFLYHRYRSIAWISLRTNSRIDLHALFNSLIDCPWDHGQTDPCPPLTVLEEMGVSYPYGDLLASIDYKDGPSGVINRIRAWMHLRRNKFEEQ